MEPKKVKFVTCLLKLVTSVLQVNNSVTKYNMPAPFQSAILKSAESSRMDMSPSGGLRERYVLKGMNRKPVSQVV